MEPADDARFCCAPPETTLEVPGFADLGMGQASRRLRCGDQLWQRFRNVRAKHRKGIRPLDLREPMALQSNKLQETLF